MIWQCYKSFGNSEKTDAIETHTLSFGWQRVLPNFMLTWRKLYPKEMEGAIDW